MRNIDWKFVLTVTNTILSALVLVLVAVKL